MSILASCENIHKTYLLGAEGVAALRGVAVEVYQGELLLIYGTSGGGKSTFLNVLGTIDVPTKGNLTLFGHRIHGSTPDDELAALRRDRVGFVFQSFNLISTMTAEENVALPMRIRGVLSSEAIDARVASLLADVGLSGRAGHYPSMLSGGEQQRVAIARSLANEPDLLLLDEPTGDLDTTNTNIVLQLLLRLQRTRKLTMAMVTHDERLKVYADRIVYFRDGKVHRIEEVLPAVREAAERALDEDVQEGAALSNTAMRIATQPSATHLVRQPSDYLTYKAQRRFDAAGDAAIVSAVKSLFLPNNGERTTVWSSGVEMERKSSTIA